MPNKIEPHDSALKKRIRKIGAVMPAALARARKYRSSGNWQKVSALHKAEFPLCCDPFNDHSKEHRSVPVDQTHHVRGLSTHFHLRAYTVNLRSLCTACHSKVEQLERANKPTQYLFKEVPEY